MEKIRILVCEDEVLISNRLVRFIEETTPFNIHISVVSNLDSAQAYFATNQVDLLFLDLNLHGKDGFDLLKNMLSFSFHTIVVSAYVDRAIEAFEYGVLDFVGKPFTKERIKKALRRYESGSDSEQTSLKYLPIRSNREISFVEIDHINFVKAAGIYSEIHLRNGSKKIFDKPLNQLLKILPKQYQRVHKSYVVPIKNIKSIKTIRTNSYILQLQDNVQIPLSRSRKKDLMKLLSFG